MPGTGGACGEGGAGTAACEERKGPRSWGGNEPWRGARKVHPVKSEGKTARYDEHAPWCGRTGAVRPPSTPWALAAAWLMRESNRTNHAGMWSVACSLSPSPSRAGRREAGRCAATQTTIAGRQAHYINASAEKIAAVFDAEGSVKVTAARPLSKDPSAVTFTVRDWQTVIAGPAI